MSNQSSHGGVVIPPIPKPIWAIGLSMFLINMSSVMIFSLSAVYLQSNLGVSTGLIGFLEGIVEGTAHATRVFSGVLSDYLRRRKLIMCMGYGLAVVARPLMGLSGSFTAVFVARMLDRLGNGIQGTPRDALIGDLAPETRRGACFGLRQSLGTAGSFAGGIAGVAAMIWTTSNYHSVFWLATIPALLALILLLVAVKEPEKNLHPADHKRRHPIHMSDIPRLGKAYWMIMIVAAFFMLSRVGEAFLVIHAFKNFGLPKNYASCVHILYNITYCIISFPIGRLSDRFSRYTLLAFGIVTLILTDMTLAFASSLPVVLLGVLMWGIQMGITQSLFSAIIADTVPEDLLGTGFGLFSLISAVSVIIASILGGRVAMIFGEWATFIYSATIAAASLAILIYIKIKRRKGSLSRLESMTSV